MTVSVSPVPFQYLPNNNNTGVPASGFRLFTYVAGTSTKQATWVDSTQTTQNDNPILLDANGFIAKTSGSGLWLDPTLTYKFVLCLPGVDDPPTSSLRTQDNLQGTITSTILYSLLFLNQTAAELSAGVTPTITAYEPFDLRRYGADPTGVANSDTAMSSAIAVCGTTGGTIRAPSGSYKFASQIDLTSKHSITIEGDGGTTNNASAATTFTYSGSTAPFVKMASSFGCSLKNMVFKTSNAGFTGAFVGTSTVSGNPFMCSMEDMFLECNSQCIGGSLDTAIGFLCKRVIFDHGKPNLIGQNSAGGSFSNVVTLINCQFNQTTGSYSVGYPGDNWSIIGCDFEPGGDGVMNGVTNTTTAPCLGLVISGNFFGDSTAPSNPITLSGSGISITGNLINAGAASGVYPSFTNVGPGVTLSTAHGVTIQGNQFSNCSIAVDFTDANCRAVRISENYLTGTNALIGHVTNAPYDLQFNPNTNLASGLQNFIPSATSTFGNFSANGFEVSQNGIIRMWGQKTVTAGTPLAITFSTEVGSAFPNACFQADCWFGAAPGASATGTYTSSTSATGTTLNVAGGTAASTVNWQAIGN